MFLVVWFLTEVFTHHDDHVEFSHQPDLCRVCLCRCSGVVDSHDCLLSRLFGDRGAIWIRAYFNCDVMFGHIRLVFN